MEKQKRERSNNFTQDETNILILLVEAKIHIIESKKSDTATRLEKESAWKDIEKSFNSASTSVFRNQKHLKLKYEALKRDTRKKCAAIRAERCRPGGGTNTVPPLTPAEEKVKEMILLSLEENESECDSDSVFPSTSTSNCMPAEEHGDQDATEKIMLAEDWSKNIMIKIEEKEEPPGKKVCIETQEDPLLQSEPDIVIQAEQQWKKCNPMFLQSKTCPVLSKKKTFDRLNEKKLEIAEIQRKLVAEELEQKYFNRKFLEQELEHKAAMHELEKQHLLLKIELLKKELDRK